MGRAAVVVGVVLVTACSGAPEPTPTQTTAPPASSVTQEPEQASTVTTPSADDADTMTYDTRILSGHVGGGALWVVRRGGDGTANRLHRIIDGQEAGVTDLPAGLVSDAAGDATGLWVATGGAEAVHLDAATGRVDRRVPVVDAEWLDVAGDTLVVAGPPDLGEDGTAVTVAHASTGAMIDQVLVGELPWADLVDVSHARGRVWLARSVPMDAPDDVQGALVAVDDAGRVVERLDLELRHLRALGTERLLGVIEVMSVRQPPDPTAVVVGPEPDEVTAVRLGRPEDAAFLAPALADDGAWVPVHVEGDGPRVVQVRADGSIPRAIRLPVPQHEFLEWVAVLDGDLWYVTSGPDAGPDGDLPTTLWRLPGVVH